MALICVIPVFLCSGILILILCIKKYRSNTILLAASATAAAMFITLYFLFINPANDVILWEMRNRLQQIPHPQSKLIKAESRIGILFGNSNHCDFYTSQARWSALSPDEIQNRYMDLRLPLAKGDMQPVTGKPDQKIFLQTVKSEGVVMLKPSDSPLEHEILMAPYGLQTIAEWQIDLSQYPTGTVYIVTYVDIGYEPDDIRCH